MEFDGRDKKIIESLYHNWRMSSSEIARKTRLSRRQVDYRLKQYFSLGSIRSIFTVFNYAKLGFRKPVYIFIGLKNKKDSRIFGEYFEKTKRCTSWGIALTEYDLFSNFIFKNKKEISRFLSDLKAKFGNKIDRFDVIDPVYAEFYPLKSIDNSTNETYVITDFNSNKVKLDSLDIEIMKQLASNARKSVVDIANEVNISPERALYRIRKLVRDKIILGSRIQFNLDKSGYFATCLFIQSNADGKILEDIKKLCKKENSINYLIVSNKSPQIIIQIFHKDEIILRQIVRKASSLLENNQHKIFLVKLEDDINVVNPLPFLN